MYNNLKLFNELVQDLLNEEQANPVAPYLKTKQLKDKIDLSLGEPLSEDELKTVLRQIIHYTPKTASKSFFNQLFGGRLAKATLGDLLAVMLNNSMYTYKVAGPQAGLEKSLINSICDIVGYRGDGTVVSGGSICNLMAMIMARDHSDSTITTLGISKKMTLYTSTESHYSISKNTSFIGIGRHQIRYISTDDKGRMLVEELEQQIQSDIKEGYNPFFVNATSGTTVLGAFDDIESISRVCKKHNLWLHVDGAYYGGVIFSEKYKHLLRGVDKADSFSFNAHKTLGVPLPCSILITPHKRQLHDSFSDEAPYLYQTDDDDFDLGRTSMQCGRRNNSLKFWTLWKSVGTKGLESIVNHLFYLGDVAREYIHNHPDYKLCSFEDSISVCFNYKNICPEKLCTALYKQAKLMVGFGEFRTIKFIRLVTINSALEEKDIINFFKTLEQFVADSTNTRTLAISCKSQ